MDPENRNGLAIPPLILQPVAPAAVAETGPPTQATMTFAMPLPPLQLAAPMAQAMGGALAQALAAGILAPVVAAGIPPPGYILIQRIGRHLP